MEELLAKIEELEEKLGGMIERYQAVAKGDSPAAEEIKGLRAEAKQLRDENRAMKATLDKVRRRVSALLERVDQVSKGGGASPGLF